MYTLLCLEAYFGNKLEIAGPVVCAVGGVSLSGRDAEIVCSNPAYGSVVSVLFFLCRLRSRVGLIPRPMIPTNWLK
jgi:hypothetical protein